MNSMCCLQENNNNMNNNENLAMILQNDYEDEFDSIISDVELVKTATKYAHDDFCVTEDNASAIGREVLKIYGEVEI